jgi:hypothetical protein
MVSKGHFILHSRAVPPLTAGDYQLEGSQRIDDHAGGSYPTEAYIAHLRVSSPRYKMPPDQILSTFPPANSEGAYEDRLPQIVLRRRTLPWERAVDADRKIPWLALVVIAEGEGALSPESPITECVTPGVTLAGPNDVPSGVYLSVPQTTVTRVFPTKEDLELLVHVREVDINDTELAIGDDDGFLAVVMANRLPQFDRIGCKPVNYLACLINLEGQVSVLPPPVEPNFEFNPNAVVFQVEAKAILKSQDLDKVIMGEPVINPAHGGDTAAKASTTRAIPSPAAPRAVTSNQWSTSPKAIEALAVSAHTKDAGAIVRDAMGSRFRFPIERMVVEPIYRFPVLAYWSFTCSGGGSFETLMQGLDVGMLGTVAGRPTGAPFPDCFVPRGGAAPPEEPPKRPAAELAETGHVGLPHLTRRGEKVRAWYRGPLVPNLLTRESAPPDGRLPLAHVSDQLRRLIPDGREDLAYACAFEIGRLLALSNPSAVAALTRWRTEQFGAARAKRFTDRLLEDVALASPNLSMQLIDALGSQISRKLVEAAAVAPDKILAKSRPLVDPGRPIEGLDGDVGTIIATGFGLEAGLVQGAIRTGNFSVLETVDVPAQVGIAVAPDALGHLTAGLDSVLAQMTQDALAGGTPGITTREHEASAAVPRSEAEDKGGSALEQLLREAVRRAVEETE